MKRILCSIALLLSLVLSASGQSMSDTQVLQYIQREMKAGTSQSQIAVHLMRLAQLVLVQVILASARAMAQSVSIRMATLSIPPPMAIMP